MAEQLSTKEIDDLLMTAYKRGYENGVASEGFTDGYTEEEVERREKEAYQKGMDEVWELCKKIWGFYTHVIIENIYDVNCFQDILETYTASDALTKIKEYEDSQKCLECVYKGDTEICDSCVDNDRYEQKLEIKIGDEVMIAHKRYIVFAINAYKYCLFDGHDLSWWGQKGNVMANSRTGRHFNGVEEIFEALKK